MFKDRMGKELSIKEGIKLNYLALSETFAELKDYKTKYILSKDFEAEN